MVNEKALLGLVKESPKILTTIYGDLAQPSVIKVGQALETVFEFSTSILLPIKLLNHKFKINFERNLNNYKTKIENIPDEKIIDVNPQIGTPIIDKLSYTTNEEIADLFTTLLSKASNIDTINQAHPSFSNLIERLSVDEARIIKYLYGKEFIPSISIQLYKTRKGGYSTIMERTTLIQNNVDLIFPQNIDTYLDNLTSMGVLSKSSPGIRKSDEQFYNPIIESYNLEELKNHYLKNGFEKVEYEKGYYNITNYGKSFIQSVK